MTNQTPLPSRGPNADERGFTLLEVIVAFAVLSSTVVVILQLFSSNLRLLGTSEDYVWAAARAESKMGEVLDSDEMEASSASETSPEGFTTETVISRVYERRTRELPIEVLEVTVRFSWPAATGGRSITLKTLKTVKKKEVGHL